MPLGVFISVIIEVLFNNPCQISLYCVSLTQTKSFSLSQKASDSWTRKDGYPAKTVATKNGFKKVVRMQVFHQVYPIWGLNTIQI